MICLGLVFFCVSHFLVGGKGSDGENQETGISER